MECAPCYTGKNVSAKLSTPHIDFAMFEDKFLCKEVKVLQLITIHRPYVLT